MSASYLELSYGQVALAALLILVNAALSMALGLGLGRRLLLAAARTTVQLLLIGLVLQWVFALDNVYVVLGLMAVMVLIAGHDQVAADVCSKITDYTGFKIYGGAHCSPLLPLPTS